MAGQECTEIWRTVNDYAGLYEVSNMGRVRRLEHTEQWLNRGRLITRIFPPKILSPGIHKPYGYQRVGLTKNREQSLHHVHVLVVIAFLGPRPDGYLCNHISGDKADNRLANLEWVTNSENQLHARHVLNRAFKPGRREWLISESRSLPSIDGQEILDEERWLPVVGFDGLYEVSDYGRVRSLPRTVQWGRDGRPVTRIFHGRILRPINSNKAFTLYRVTLHKGSAQHLMAIHTIVLTAFVGPCPKGHTCNHLDGDRSNNVLSNLQWATLSEQQQHARYVLKRDYTCHLRPRYGRENPISIIPNTTLILHLQKQGFSRRSIAKQVGSSPRTVGRVIRGIHWSQRQQV